MKETPWETLYDKIIVKRHEADTRLKGVDVAPAHEKLKNTGIVVGVGSGRLNPGVGYEMPLKIGVGMEVLFHEHSGVPVDPGDESVLILREDEVLAYRWPATSLAAVEEKTG